MVGVNKSLAILAGKPVVLWSLEALEAHALIQNIILVVPRNDMETYETIASLWGLTKMQAIVAGGAERQTSIHNGLRAVGAADVVVIHNGANPFVTPAEISAVVLATLEAGAAAVGQPSMDTLRRVGHGMMSLGTIQREGIWRMQTPQALRYDLAIDAFERADRDGFLGTDDVQLVERLGQSVRVLRSAKYNMKITTPEDLRLAEALVQSRLVPEAA
jgi:2-C-methyl-D-erythritol 4-phosphate cytidylyltransferase